MRAVVVLMLTGAAAAAQVGAPYDRPAGFGQRFGPPPVVVPPVWGGWGFPAFYPYSLFPPASSAVYPSAYPVAPPTATEAIPATGRLIGTHFLSSDAGRAKAAETAKLVQVPTRLTLELPAAGEVWVNGTKQPGGPAKTHALTADVAPGGSHTFAVVARWTAGGTAFEYTKTAALTAGDSKSVLVSAGTPVPAK